MSESKVSAPLPVTPPAADEAAAPAVLPVPVEPTQASPTPESSKTSPPTGEAPATTPTTPAEPGPVPAPVPEPDPNDVGFDLRFMDFAGKPIKDLPYKIITVEDGKRLEFPGSSDAQGKGAKMSGMPVDTPLEIWVKKLDGSFDRKYKGTVGCKDTSVCLVSPHIVVKVKPELHDGSPGPASAPPPKPAPEVEHKPNATVASNPSQVQNELKLKPGRDANGHPILTAEPTRDAAGRNRLPTLGLWRHEGLGDTPGKTDPRKRPGFVQGPIVDVKKVEELIKIMEQQVTWDWNGLKATYGTTMKMQEASENGTFKAENNAKESGVFHGQCYSSVKLALWRAHQTEGVDGGVYPATQAGQFLRDQGFVEVTKELPDARWAAPGDVVVYQYDDETIAKNEAAIAEQLKAYEVAVKAYPNQLKAYDEAHKAWMERTKPGLLPPAPTHGVSRRKKDPEPKRPSPPQRPQGQNYGHIDVRTYDGYLSDAKTLKLPSAVHRGGRKGFVVNGIYRKFYDPLADQRLRAFLRAVREWECHEEKDDSARYFLLFNPINGSRRFSDTRKHPYDGLDAKGDTPSGAYQINLPTYKDFSTPQLGFVGGFDPAIQDRLAVAIFEFKRLEWNESPLAAIRNGNIENAVKMLSSRWASLPGGSQPRKEKVNGSFRILGMEEFVARYKILLAELKDQK